MAPSAGVAGLMFKRIFSRILGRKVKEGGKKDSPSNTGSIDKLNPDGVFQITLPITFDVQTAPLQTFSERAIREYRRAVIAAIWEAKRSIFQPQPNGRLRIYAPTAAEDDKKRRN